MSKLLSATKGTSALRLDYAPQDRYREIAERINREQQEQERRREAQERARRRQAKQKAYRLKLKLMITGLVMLAFVVCAAIVLVHAQISTMTRSIGKLKTEISTYTREIETLSVEVEETSSLNEMMEIAREKLKMGPAKQYQYIAIDMTEVYGATEAYTALDLEDMGSTVELLRELLD